MATMKPRSYDDHVRLYALAHLHGYAFEWSDEYGFEPRYDRRSRRRTADTRPRASRRLVASVARAATGRRRVAASVPKPC